MVKRRHIAHRFDRDLLPGRIGLLDERT